MTKIYTAFLKSTILIIFVFIAIQNNLVSQHEPSINSNQVWRNQIAFDLGLAIPGGDHKSLFDLKTGFGGDFTYYYQILDNRRLFISASAGIHKFGTSTTLHDQMSYTVIPITAGVRYNFQFDKNYLYVGGEFGAAFTDISYIIVGKTETFSTSPLTLIPKVGARVFLQEQIDLDVNLKYNMVLSSPSFNYIGINVGIAYTLHY